MMRVFALVTLAALLPGCAWIGLESSTDDYLEASSIERVKIPDGLDEPVFEDALVIPNVLDPRQIAGQKVDLGLPEALSTNFGVDQIVIKRLEEDRWVFVDSPAAMVWPKVRAFFASNRIPLQYADPARGEMQTEWLPGDGPDAEAIFEAIKRDVAGATARTRHQFRIRLESGIRPGSTEIYIEHKSLPTGGMIRTDVEYDGESDDDDMERVLLTDVAYYLGENINTQPAFSAMASTVGGGQKAELVPDNTRPVLKYRLSFERAWATVGNALEDARIDVEDLDRSSATYYVYYDDQEVREPGFFGRLFGGSEEERAPGAAHRYEVRLNNQDNEVHVTVMSDAETLANALIAEKLLKIIKQYST